MSNLSEEEKKAIAYFESNLEMTKEMGKRWGFQEEIKNNEIILKLIRQQKERINYLEDLLSTMEEYYSITVEDLENCIKNDK